GFAKMVRTVRNGTRPVQGYRQRDLRSAQQRWTAMAHLSNFLRGLPIFRATGVGALLAALAFGLPGTLPAQQFRKDPALDLRQAIKRKDTAAPRGPNLEMRANAIRSPGDLARALLLIDWQIGNLDAQISAVDTKVYRSLLDRFTEAVKQVMNSRDPVR